MSKSKSSAEIKTVKSFKEFREGFLREIALTDFGENINAIADEGARSPAAKELAETGAHKILSSDTFLRSVHRFVKECLRLSQEQSKVKTVRREVGLFIKGLRDKQKTLARIQAEITALDKRSEQVLSSERREHLEKAVKELELVKDALSSLERAEASHIHPHLRRKHDRIAGKRLEYITGFKSLLPRFDYELVSLNKKAPMQWLTEALDSEVNRFLNRATIELSAATRHRIIAEILASGGLPEKSAKTIKQHFVEKKKLTKPSARN